MARHLLCRRCGLNDGWSDFIRRFVYKSGRGMKPQEIALENMPRICLRCSSWVRAAAAFEKHLPKGFGWVECEIHLRGGGREVVERIIPNRT